MITKQDCLLLLADLRKNGIDTTEQTKELVMSEYPSIDVIKFINNQKPLDARLFYEKVRKSYNEKHSKLYINIMKEIEDPTEVLTTLAGLQTLIIIYSKLVQDKSMFFRHCRSDEISKVLGNYFKTFDITPCIKLVKLIKADIKALSEKDINV